MCAIIDFTNTHVVIIIISSIYPKSLISMHIVATINAKSLKLSAAYQPIIAAK